MNSFDFWSQHEWEPFMFAMEEFYSAVSLVNILHYVQF